jgi:transposase
MTRTGAPWRDLPDEPENWSSVDQKFPRWSLDGVWDIFLEALADCGAAPKAVLMIDATLICAHHQAAGVKGGLKKRVFTARAAALRQNFMPARMAKACALASLRPAARPMTSRLTTS